MRDEEDQRPTDRMRIRMRPISIVLATAVLATFASSSGADGAPRPAPATPLGVLPAGACGFDPYLGGACTSAASFAVTWDASDAAAATTLLATARTKSLAVGYPFAASYDELAARDATKKGIAIILGLFATEAEARSLATSSSANVVALTSVEAKFARDSARQQAFPTYDRYEASSYVAIEMLDDAKAFSAADVGAIDAQGASGPLGPRIQRRTAAIAAATARCTVARGRVFSATRARAFQFARAWMPVTCPDGSEAWVSERVTRFESVVTRDGRLHQVIEVSCDVPTLEARSFATPLSSAVGDIVVGHCD